MAGEIISNQCITDIFESMELNRKNLELNLVREWLNNHKKLDCWINGKYFTHKSSQYNALQSEDGVHLCEISDGSICVDSALESSLKAQSKWEATSNIEKSNLLYKLSKELNSKSQLFAQFSEFCLQKNDFSLFLDYFNYYSDWAVLLDDNRKWKPDNVVVVILGHHAPLHALSMIVAPALAAGSSVIIKPSSKTPFSAFLLGECCSKVGFPDGVLNILTGSKKVVEVLLSKKVSKTVLIGDNVVAQNLHPTNISKTFAFLNFNQTSAIVLDGCDLDAAVDKICSETWNPNHYSMWGVSVVVVQEAISSTFISKLESRMKNITEGNEIPSIFRDKIVAERVKAVISSANSIGAVVIGNSTSDDVWSPTIIKDFQRQHSEPGVPVITILTCRTAKEAVSLVNNSKYCLATSIWTEITAQALEVAYMLRSSTIWVNCHGVNDASVPIQPNFASGIGCFGGKDGILEYLNCSNSMGNNSESSFKLPVDHNSNLNRLTLSKIVQGVRKAFLSWQKESNRRKYFYDLAESLDKDYAFLITTVHFWAATTVKLFLSTQQNTRQDLIVTQTKEPVGVIAIFISDIGDAVKLFAHLVMPAIALGNGVVIIATEDNIAYLKPLVQLFSKSLPPNIISIICGYKAAIHLATEPDIDAIWLATDSTMPTDFLHLIKPLFFKSFKRIWITPNAILRDHELFGKHCLKNKIVWLTKVNQFS